jgi:hypothetical protein
VSAPVISIHVESRWARFKRMALVHLRRRSTKAAIAVLVGGLLSALCEIAPQQFKASCHLAARICQALLGVP